ncbi:MAG: hypothetical protein QXE31_06250 [Candidatus Woesearchaeota archaeon]
MQLNIRLTNKKNKKILTKLNYQKTAEELAGKEGILIFNYLKNKVNISEYVISEDTKLEIHKVRKILYKFYECGFADYLRKKDPKKGWYISYWSLNNKRFKEFVYELHKRKLSLLKEKLKKEQENIESFYLCPNLCLRLNFEKAMDFNFHCPECGKILNIHDNKKTIDYLKNEINNLEMIV